VDIKEILYTEIDKIGGKDTIRSKLSKDISNSKSIINNLLDKCSVLLNKDNHIEDDYVLFSEALLHFLLTMAMIPAERKIVIDNIDIHILIPNIKNLKSDNDKAIMIHFVKDRNENLCDIIRKMSTIQKNKNNIWIVSSKDLNSNLDTFIVSHPSLMPVYDNDKRSIYPFSEILVKIDEFLKSINYSGLKML
jgi:hypothetical protein